MRKPILIGAAAAAITAAGCGIARSEPGPATQRSYTVAEFERIKVAGPYDVEVRTGSAPSVQAQGPENMIERMVVEVEDGALNIHTRRRNGFNFGWNGDGTVKLTVTVPALSGASIAGSGGIRVDRVRGDRFAGSVAGSGDLTLDSVEVGALELDIAGSGEARARSGRARTVTYEIAGSGDIDGRNVPAETAAVSISGSGNIAANATRTAAVSIAGSGDVEVTGGAKCTVKKAGSGDVRCS